LLRRCSTPWTPPAFSGTQSHTAPSSPPCPRAANGLLVRAGSQRTAATMHADTLIGTQCSVMHSQEHSAFLVLDVACLKVALVLSLSHYPRLSQHDCCLPFPCIHAQTMQPCNRPPSAPPPAAAYRLPPTSGKHTLFVFSACWVCSHNASSSRRGLVNSSMQCQWTGQSN
jgi:hypothetical protein